MKKIVIIGAGFAGLHIFYKLRYLIGKKLEIVVIDPRSYSLLKPSLPEVAFDGVPISHSLVELAYTIETKKAKFIQDEVINIDEKNNILTLKDGEPVIYDYLFITIGAVKDYDAIKGFREHGYSVCDDMEAQRLWEKVNSFKGGKIVTGASLSTWGNRVDAPPLKAPCEGPIGEIMFMFDFYLKNKKHSENYTIDIFTPGEVFFEDVGDIPREAIGKFMGKLNMPLHHNKILKEIGQDFIAFEDGTQMPCDLAIVIPPYTAPKVLQQSNLGDEKGFIPTDKQMRHLDFPNIFAAGDITSLAQPKLGHIAVIQGGIAATTLLKELGEDVEIPPHDLEVFCIMNMGGYEATLIQSNVLYGGKTDIAFHSPIARMMKWGFDSDLYYNRGNMPPDIAMEATEKLVKTLL